MPETSARLSLPFLLPNQAQKHVTHNEALQRLDALTQLALEARGAETPPADPAEGAIYALGSAPQEAWAGQEGMLAVRVAPTWQFIAPAEGWRAWNKTTGSLCHYADGGWQDVVPPLQNIDGLGINTGSDTTNRLALAADAALFSHAGAGHRLKINKAATAETASLLYQSAWTGHAEMGLTGDTDFHIKVSEDGSTWTDAMIIDAATGHIGGAAVQTGPTDVTPGRLMRADYGFGPGNLLGPVSQSGGTPTGAVIERGGNASGAYVRFADGTQICSHDGFIEAYACTLASGPIYRGPDLGIPNFPAAFQSPPTLTITAHFAASIAGKAVRNGTVSPTAPAGSGQIAIEHHSSITQDARWSYLAIGRWF